MFGWQVKFRVAILSCAAGAIAIFALAGNGSAATPGCGAFAAQADAQDGFVALAGSPSRNVGAMDPDRDGVACEALPAPYKGYATLGYNRKKQFLYGIATMPAGSDGAEPPCMIGNRNFDDSPRKINVYRVLPSGDKPILGRYRGATEARPQSARLVWKAERGTLDPGRYYVSFEERIRLHPYGRNECPGFSSRTVVLPTPAGKRPTSRDYGLVLVARTTASRAASFIRATRSDCLRSFGCPPCFD